MRDMIVFFFLATYGLMFIFFLINSINSFRSFRYLKRNGQNQKDMEDTVLTLERKIDELRIQVGIVSGRMGDYGRMINIQTTPQLKDAHEVRKPGWPLGKPRKHKNDEQV